MILIGSMTPLAKAGTLDVVSTADGRCQRTDCIRVQCGTLSLTGLYRVRTEYGMKNLMKIRCGNKIMFQPEPVFGPGRGLYSFRSSLPKRASFYELWSIGAEAFKPSVIKFENMHKYTDLPQEVYEPLKPGLILIPKSERFYRGQWRKMNTQQCAGLLAGILFAVSTWQKIWFGLNLKTKTALIKQLARSPLGRLAGHHGIIIDPIGGSLDPQLKRICSQRFKIKPDVSPPETVQLSVTAKRATEAPCAFFQYNPSVRIPGLEIEGLLYG